MPKHGKKFTEAQKKIDPQNLYGPDEAIALLKDVAFANFDETVEVHARLGIDPRQADQTVRSTVVLPHGTGKTVRVLVFAATTTFPNFLSSQIHTFCIFAYMGWRTESPPNCHARFTGEHLPSPRRPECLANSQRVGAS